MILVIKPLEHPLLRPRSNSDIKTEYKTRTKKAPINCRGLLAYYFYCQAGYKPIKEELMKKMCVTQCAVNSDAGSWLKFHLKAK